jgi:hypothetical protein
MEETMYNTDNDENVVVAKMDEIAPINDPECRHETLVPDPDDTIGDAIYHGCANPKCGRGFYLKNKNIT